MGSGVQRVTTSPISRWVTLAPAKTPDFWLIQMKVQEKVSMEGMLNNWNLKEFIWWLSSFWCQKANDVTENFQMFKPAWWVEPDLCQIIEFIFIWDMIILAFIWTESNLPPTGASLCGKNLWIQRVYVCYEWTSVVTNPRESLSIGEHCRCSGSFNRPHVC